VRLLYFRQKKDVKTRSKPSRQEGAADIIVWHPPIGFRLKGRRNRSLRIKKTTFYALKVIYRIHLEDKAVVTSSEIAEKEHLSQGVLLRVMQQLRSAGILSVYQGRGAVSGGFQLNRPIDDITLMDVVDVMETIDICENLGEDDVLLHVCRQINEHLKEEFAKYSLRDVFT